MTLSAHRVARLAALGIVAVTLMAAVRASTPAIAQPPQPALVAIIIDDMGLDRRRSARVVALPAPLTLSFMTYAGNLEEQAQSARALGHEVMLHVPMQPWSAALDPGPDALDDQLPSIELRRRLVQDLARLDGGYVGINNHMGSRFTTNTAGMRIVMQELRKRGLLFVDSLTSGASVGLRVARENGVAAAARDIFIDNLDNAAALARQLAQIEQLAHKNGTAIAIGHPHDGTIDALAAWLPTLAAKGLTLVPVSRVVAARGQ